MIKVGAHRGASGWAPENTMAAFELAIDKGADLIEFDVQLTRDQVAVVIHDEWVDRTSNGHGRVCDLAWQELKTMDFGSYRGAEFTGCRLPTLDEVLELGAGNCQMNIEIKNGPVYYPQIEDIIIDRIKAHHCREQVIISSFDHHAISRCHRLDPGVRLAYLIAHRPLEMAGMVPAFRL
ncbi:MAG: glycerophosphodiester phosphodiesterase, partial [Methylocystaceae bacterium]